MLYKVVVDERLFGWLLLGWATRMVRPRIGVWVDVRAGDKLSVKSMGAHDPIILNITDIAVGATVGDLIDGGNYLRVCPNASSPDTARRSVSRSLSGNRLTAEIDEYIAIELAPRSLSSGERAASSLM